MEYFGSVIFTHWSGTPHVAQMSSLATVVAVVAVMTGYWSVGGVIC